MARSDDPANWEDGYPRPAEGVQPQAQPDTAHGYDPNSNPVHPDPYAQPQAADPYAQPAGQTHAHQQADPNAYQQPQTQQFAPGQESYPAQPHPQAQNYGQPAPAQVQHNIHTPVPPEYQQAQAHQPQGRDPYQQAQPVENYPPQLGEIASQVQAGSTAPQVQHPQPVADPYQDINALNPEMRHEHSQPGPAHGHEHSQYAAAPPQAEQYGQPHQSQLQQPMVQPTHDLARQTADELQSYYNQQNAFTDPGAQQSTAYSTTGLDPAQFGAPSPIPTHQPPRASDYDLGGVMASEPQPQVQAPPDDHFHVSTDLSSEAAQVDFGQPVQREPSLNPTPGHDIGHVAEHFTQGTTGALTSLEPQLQTDAEFYTGEFDDEEYEDYDEPSSRMGGMVKLVTTLGLAIITGAGLAYGYKFFVSPNGANKVPAIIRADVKPAKMKPKNPGGKKFSHTKKAIFDRVGGPSRPNSRIASDSASSMPGISLSGVPSIPAAPRSGAPNGGTKKVKTVSVRPDGSYAPSKPLRPSRPADISKIAAQADNVEIPGITVGGVKPAALVRPAARKPAAAVRKSLTDELVRKAGVAKPTPKKPVKMASVAAKPRIRPKVAVGTSPNGYVSQISARKSRLDALSAFADLRQKYSTVLGNAMPDIQEANLGSKGVWYRLRIGPPGSKQAATDICNKLKSAGHKGCFVRAY